MVISVNSTVMQLKVAKKVDIKSSYHRKRNFLNMYDDEC